MCVSISEEEGHGGNTSRDRLFGRVLFVGFSKRSKAFWGVAERPVFFFASPPDPLSHTFPFANPPSPLDYTQGFGRAGGRGGM